MAATDVASLDRIMGCILGALDPSNGMRVAHSDAAAGAAGEIPAPESDDGSTRIPFTSEVTTAHKERLGGWIVNGSSGQSPDQRVRSAVPAMAGRGGLGPDARQLPLAPGGTVDDPRRPELPLHAVDGVIGKASTTVDATTDSPTSGGRGRRL